MQGYQLTFCTGDGRHHGHKPMARWPMETIKSLGIMGATMTVGVGGVGRDGKAPLEFGVVGDPKP